MLSATYRRGLNHGEAPPTMGSVVALEPSGILQMVTPPYPWLPVASHWPSGLTEIDRQSSSGPTVIVLSACVTWA